MVSLSQAVERDEAPELVESASMVCRQIPVTYCDSSETAEENVVAWRQRRSQEACRSWSP